MHAVSIKAVELMAESACKVPKCPCKAKELPIVVLSPPNMPKLTKKERKQALRTKEFEERLATIAKAAQNVNRSNVRYLPAPPPRITEEQIYLEFDAPISEHMMT